MMGVFFKESLVPALALAFFSSLTEADGFRDEEIAVEPTSTLEGTSLGSILSSH